MTRIEQRRNKVKTESLKKEWGFYIHECLTDEELDEQIAGFVEYAEMREGRNWFKELKKYWEDYIAIRDDIRGY
tara:strand:+ start:185 stop:406 length:222 start_codon:yes stop_codon:yes gene_type:complete